MPSLGRTLSSLVPPGPSAMTRVCRLRVRVGSWCGHCKKLAPLWDELASRDLGDVRIGRVDCTRDRPLCKEYGIGGYPMLLLVTAAKAAAERKLYRYSGRRTLDALAAFATGGWQGQEECARTPRTRPRADRCPGPRRGSFRQPHQHLLTAQAALIRSRMRQTTPPSSPSPSQLATLGAH